MFDNLEGTSPDVLAELEEPGQEGIEAETSTEEEAETENVEAETPEEKAEAPKEEQPELLLGKFKSQDDLAEAYKNLEKELTKSKQELSKFSKAPEAPTPEQPRISKEELNAKVLESFANDPLGTITQLIQYANRPVMEYVGQQQQRSLLDSFKAEHADYAELEPDIQTVWNDRGFGKAVNAGVMNPQLALQTAYEAAKSKRAIEEAQKAYEKGLADAYKSKESKGKAQIEGGGTKTKQAEKSPEDQLVEDILAARSSGIF